MGTEDARATAVTVDEQRSRLAANPDFNQIRGWVESAKANPTTDITTAEQYETLATVVRDELKPRLKKARDFFKKLKDAVNASKDVILDAERDHCDVLADVIKRIEKGLLDYNERIETERKRQEDEARAKAEAEELDRILGEADRLREGGDEEAATELLAAPPRTVTTPAPPVAGPKVRGVATTERWSAKVVDFKRFVRWVAQDPDTRGHYVTVNQTALNTAAVGQREALAIPGVTAESSKSIAIRSRKRAGE